MKSICIVILSLSLHLTIQAQDRQVDKVANSYGVDGSYSINLIYDEDWGQGNWQVTGSARISYFVYQENEGRFPSDIMVYGRAEEVIISTLHISPEVTMNSAQFASCTGDNLNDIPLFIKTFDNRASVRGIDKPTSKQFDFWVNPSAYRPNQVPNNTPTGRKGIFAMDQIITPDYSSTGQQEVIPAAAIDYSSGYGIMTVAQGFGYRKKVRECLDNQSGSDNQSTVGEGGFSSSQSQAEQMEKEREKVRRERENSIFVGLIQEAQKLYSDRQYDAALSKAESALRIDPDNEIVQQLVRDIRVAKNRNSYTTRAAESQRIFEESEKEAERVSKEFGLALAGGDASFGASYGTGGEYAGRSVIDKWAITFAYYTGYDITETHKNTKLPIGIYTFAGSGIGDYEYDFDIDRDLEFGAMFGLGLFRQNLIMPTVGMAWVDLTREGDISTEDDNIDFNGPTFQVGVMGTMAEGGAIYYVYEYNVLIGSSTIGLGINFSRF